MRTHVNRRNRKNSQFGKIMKDIAKDIKTIRKAVSAGALQFRHPRRKTSRAGTTRT